MLKCDLDILLSLIATLDEAMSLRYCECINKSKLHANSVYYYVLDALVEASQHKVQTHYNLVFNGCFQIWLCCADSAGAVVTSAAGGSGFGGGCSAV